MSVKPLTPREREILQLIALGMDGHFIADQLGISIKTYDSHRLHILEKLECGGTNVAATLARYAIATGMVDPPQREDT